MFNNWLKNEWLPAYKASHPGLNNVAVFDLFDVLAYPDSDPSHPNRLKAEYGGTSGDSHPNAAADGYATQLFATDTTNFLDVAWNSFVGTTNVELITNGGFETGDSTGWATTGSVTIVTASFGSGPPEGDFDALLATSDAVPVTSLEAFLGLAPGSLTALDHGTVTEGSRSNKPSPRAPAMWSL